MLKQQPSFTGRLLKKSLSVTLVVTLLLSMVIVGNVFGVTASAAETRTEGDYTFTVENDAAQITKYSGDEASVTVPATLGGVSVTSIGKNAFENDDTLVSLIISEGIQTIGNYAFNDCDYLESITLASTVTAIGNYAFAKCKALQTIDVPATVKTLGEGAFYQCPILGEVTLHEGLETLGNKFIAGTVVSTVYIPTTLTKATESFREANLLDSVTFGAGITALPRDLFEGNSSLREITIPATVTTLGVDCFAHMGSLESMVIPDTVTEWGNYVLFDCPKLKTVTIGTGVSNVPEHAFEGCVLLTEITIPDNVTKIGHQAFKDCSRLATVTLSKNLTSIGSYTFERTPIREITIPANLTGGYAPFNECTSLKTVHLTAGATTYPEALLSKTVVETVDIPEGVTELPRYFCSGCQKLTTVNLPSTLRTIRYYAFSDCPVLNHVEIPESVKTIEERVFQNDAGLTDFTLHEGVQTLGSSIFANSALTSIYIPKTLSTTNAPFQDSNIERVTFCDGIATLNDNLFKGMKKLTSLKIPATVVKIGNSCFRESNLEAMVIPDTVKTLGNSVFEQCDNLYAVRIGAGIRKLPQWCFYGCDVLQNVVIPETVLEMDANVFEASGLTYQKLPQSIHDIPYQAFKDCKSLVTVECSDELESIGDYAFERCYDFTTLKTAQEDVTFNNSTFKDCPKFVDPRFYVFNAANTGFESTGNIGVDHTLVHFTVRYDIRDDWDDADIKMQRLYLSYPNNLEIVPASFVAEGFDFDNTAYTGDYKSFDLTGGKSSGTLRFSAYLNSSGDALKNVSAEVAFRYRTTDFRKPLGELQFTTAKLSLFAPSNVTQPTVNVSGFTASADKDVTVSISRIKDGAKDCTVTHTVTPNKYTGKYTAEELAIVPEGKTANKDDEFEIVATCNGVKSDVVRFSYTPGALRVVKAIETVNVTKFIAPGVTNLSHGGQANTYDITGVFTKGTSPVVSLNPAEMIQFKFDLENDENISTLILMSHRGNDWHYMELFYDAESDMWIGEGYFDITDHQLVPGQYNVPGAFNLLYFNGKREDNYRSILYGEDSGVKPVAPVGGKEISPVGEVGDSDVPYYVDSHGVEHGNPGDYNQTVRVTGIKIFKDIITGNVAGGLSDAVTGGLKWFTQWGRTNHNLVRTLNHGIYLDDNGLPVLPGDVPNGGGTLNKDPSKDGKQRNSIDPSGYVYEAVEGNRVENAVMTLYMLDEESGEWVEWNAVDYEQQNPLMTNNEGAYAWMTDAGKYRVTVSKEGYETQTSEEFDVPPEKLDLNFGLVDTTTHPIATVEKDAAPGAYLLKFSKFMKPETVTADTVTVDGLANVGIEPVYLNEGDAYADTFRVTGALQKPIITFSVSEAAQSYSGVSAEATTDTISEAFLGDVDGDGKVDINDATTIQKYLAEVELPTLAFIELCGDVDGDGKVDINDVTTIQKFIAEYDLPYAIGDPIQA